MYKDLKYLIGGSCFLILTLVGGMLFSPLSSQFTDEDISRGSSWNIELDQLFTKGQTEYALSVVDSLIEVKSKELPRFAYFDRFLSEEERYDATNARADIYDLWWMRIDILQKLNETVALREDLKDYSKIIGYNQEAAKAMLKQLKDK